MARYNLFVLKLPLNTNQPTNMWLFYTFSNIQATVIYVGFVHLLVTGW